MKLARYLIIAGLLLTSYPSLADESSITTHDGHGPDQFTFIDHRFPFLTDHSYPLLTLKDPNHWTGEFNKAANRHDMYGKITDCKLLIDIPVGTKDGNHSYGAYCEVQQDLQKQVITLCNDIMLDRFKVGIAVDLADKKSLAEFVITNCYGG